MSLVCPICGGGPFKSKMGLHRHMYSRSPDCGNLFAINRPKTDLNQRRTAPADETEANQSAVDSNITASASFLSQPSPSLEFASAAPESSFGTDILNYLMESAVQANHGINPAPEETYNNDDTGFQADDDSGNEMGLDMTFSGKVHSPSTVPLPDSVKECMFKEPEGFDSHYLYNSVCSGESVKFADSMWDKMSPKEKSTISLLKILKGKELALFDKIMQWRWKSDNEYGYKVCPKTSPPSREKCLKDLMNIYGYSGLKPKDVRLTLPNTGVVVSVPQFSFGQMLASLLMDPVAMQPENLNIDPKDPFCPPPTAGPNDDIGDFNTGTVHRMAWERLARGKQRRIVCETPLFVDKTHLDTKGKHTLEPIMFTLGIFNREFRNKPEAWRPLGFIPNLDHLAPHAKTEERQADYHYLLRILLSEMVSFQRLDGIYWVFNFGHGDCPATLEIPVNEIVSDNEGHDKVIARYVDRQGTSNRGLCRYCSCSFGNLGNPFEGIKAKLTSCGPVRNLRNKGDLDSIKKLSGMDYKPFHDGLVDIHFSDPERGLHGCCPAEVLHTFQMGLAERSIMSAFDIRRVRKGRKRKGSKRSEPKHKKQRFVEDFEGGGSDESDCSGDEQYSEDEFELITEQESDPVLDPDDIRKNAAPFRVFNAKAKERVDKLAKKLHRYLRWQSERGLPRTSFPQGITSLTKMQGSERTGVLIVLFLIMILEHWGNWRPMVAGGVKEQQPGYIENSMGTERASNVVKSLFLLITFDAFLRADKIPASCLKDIEDFMPRFLDQILRTFNREEGAGNNLIKNHLFLHLAFDILRLGVPGNFNSSIGELCHKIICKITGRRTNMNSLSFGIQTGLRYVENLTVERAYVDHPEWTDGIFVVPADEQEIEETSATAISYHGNFMVVGREYLVNRTGKKTFLQMPIWDDSYESPDEMIGIIRDKVLPHLDSKKEVKLYTKTVRNGVTFSCSPSYGRNRLSKQDWCYVFLGDDEDDIPYQLLVIFQIEDDPLTSFSIGGIEISKKGYYALGHYALENLRDYGTPLYEGDNNNEGNRAHADQFLVHRIPKWHKTDDGNDIPATSAMPPTLACIPCDSISRACVAFPDILCDDPDNNFFFMKPTDTWSQLFIDMAKIRG